MLATAGAVDHAAAVAVPKAISNQADRWHRRKWFAPGLALAGLGSWVYGITQTSPTAMHMAGLLLGANAWIPLGFALLISAIVCELTRSPIREHVMSGLLAVLLVMIYAANPIVFHGPEYPWVYKHLGVIAEFQHYGRAVNPTDIYNAWPTLFAGVAAIASLAGVKAVSFAAWAPLFFELGGALLVVAMLRQLTDDRRIVWLSVVLYEGFIPWIGQDYLSPQAFSYLLWLGVVWIMLRWLRAPTRPVAEGETAHGLRRIPAWLLTGLQPVGATSKRSRILGVALLTLLYGVLVTAHQLTPYIGLISAAALAAFSILRPRSVVLLMAVLAGGYLALHWHLIATEYLSEFGGDPVGNAGGITGATGRSVAELWTQRGSTLVMYGMWLGAVVVTVINLRRPGPYLIAIILALSPVLIVLTSSYGGEAIYRAFLFSAPASALLIATTILTRFRGHFGTLVLVVAVAGTLVAGTQGRLGMDYDYSFTTSEVAASEWLYAHVPANSLIILPSDTFPVSEADTYAKFTVKVMPADPYAGAARMSEANASSVASWLEGLKRPITYVVTSESMRRSAHFTGTPRGYDTLAANLRRGFLGAVPIFRNATTSIYRLNFGVDA